MESSTSKTPDFYSATVLTFGSYGNRVHSQNMELMLCVLIISLLQWLRTFLLTCMKCLKGGLKYPIYIVSSQSKSGIDAFCLDPFFSSMVEDIFGDLHAMLERRPKISNIHCGKSAKVPLTRFKCDGGSFEGLVPSAGWEMRRKFVIQKLK
ncbi:nuclear poly(A) polymerase 3 isoform X1 [Senna tora]|uniref:Nuclear poly(A) polymerase 3 isoform X1 n=1 Tax=Senna tora TaxID=362788 RepID=A0A834TI15_9FABA|nr:nuclear poly(A) polymerase 3 isoform X1 [Senna tora]